MMDTLYSILGAILPSEAYQYTFMKNALSSCANVASLYNS